MDLHENADDFRELVALTSEYFGRAVSFIVKDYFAVTMFKELTSADSDLVFKGRDLGVENILFQGKIC